MTQAMTHAAAAQQQAQAQLLRKTIGTARTGSTESTASLSQTNSSQTHLSSNTDAGTTGVHKPPRGHPQQQPYPHPGIPVSRSSGSTGNQSLYKPGKQHMTSAGSQEFDHDHQTFATATTASATISYSTDEVDHTNSDVSEAGMEVVMDTDASSGDERNLEEQILSLSKQPRLANKPKEEPYKSHSFPAGKHTFTVDTRYGFIRVIGSGAYGVVISA
ncbi:Mitogen-activated protein kinase (Partial), partial [Seminavis robusta]